MIKFFRKIRQNLLMENKTGKYLKYAIGEIVLVVIGILLALGINNWNQDRITQNRIESRLTSLTSDIESEIDAMDEIIIRSEGRIAIIYDIMKRNNKPEAIPWYDKSNLEYLLDSIDNPNASLSISPTFDVNKATFTELLNTGEFYTIVDKALSREIQQYYARIDDLKESEQLNQMGIYLRIIESKERLGIGVYAEVSMEKLAELAKNDKQFGAELETSIGFDWLQRKNFLELKQRATSLIESMKNK
jgi:type II secretory pathway pseudopilin PulG